MTRLLVSVRNADEAIAAFRGGAALVDIKEPDRGPLGCADSEQWHAIVHALEGRAPISVALGELHDAALDQRVAALPEVAFAKCGLARCGRRDNWPERLRSVMARLAPATGAVAVVYVDWSAAGAPPPQEVLDQARRLRCPAVLWDTYAKSGGHLLDYIGGRELASMIDSARRDKMIVALAGSLTLDMLGDVLALAPDYVAVRRAVCEGGRTGPVRAHLVRQFARALGRPPTALVAAGD